MSGGAFANDLALAYLRAKQRIIRSGFAAEIAWQAGRDLRLLTEPDFLREGAWVVLCSGFRESIIRARFDAISSSFLEWIDSASIVRHRKRCRTSALRVFSSTRKIDAIIEIAERVKGLGFSRVVSELSMAPLRFIGSLPFMGSVTSLHFAKNLGVQVVKPDRHLVRLATAAGCPSPQEMCEKIATMTDEKISVVDLVMWRYATIDPDYEAFFRSSGLH
jgi:hypothetical protein